MGLGTNERSNVQRLRIGIKTDDKGRKSAVIGLRCEAGTPGAKQVFKSDGEPAMDKDGKNVYRLEYGYVEGRIVKLEKQSVDFGKGNVELLDITITDEAGDVYVLQVDRGDRYWADFLMKLPNVNLSLPVRIAPFNFEGDDGKKMVGVTVTQNGSKVPRKWTKENNYENGPPEATYDEDEKKWLFGKRNKWMDTHIVDWYAAELAAKPTAVPATVAEPPAGEEDDLPF